MRRYPTIELWLLGLLAVCLLAGTTVAKTGDVAKSAEEILDTTGVQGGIVVHLGCGDGRLTAALRASDSYTVHGLERDPAKVAKARSYIHAQGIYGPVSVAQYSGSVLPYTDNLVNLIVAEDAGDVNAEEMMRVLTPGGAVCT
ncbi:MAG: class I SAM-dependent methyltransferase, partial [Phycisphaerales bacterium]